MPPAQTSPTTSATIIDSLQLPAVTALLQRHSTPFPLTDLSQFTTDETVSFAISHLDSNGQLAAKAAVTAVGWPPGHPTILTVTYGLCAVQPAPPDNPGGNSGCVTGRRYLHIPAPTRHALALHTSDAILIAALKDHNTLVLYPPQRITAMINLLHTSLTANPPK